MAENIKQKLELFRKALGQGAPINDLLPARLTQKNNQGNEAASSSPLFNKAGGRPTDPPGPPGPANPPNPADSAIARLRQRARDRSALYPSKSAPGADQPTNKDQETAKTHTAKTSQTAQSGQSGVLAPSAAHMAGAPASDACKPWGGASAPGAKVDSRGYAQEQAPARPMSAVERLRATASGVAPKRLEGRDQDQLGEPLVQGGARIPMGYPGGDSWPDNHRPPGSRYDAKEWWMAHTGLSSDAYESMDEQARSSAKKTAWVVEILGASGSVLMRIPKSLPAPSTTPISLRSRQQHEATGIANPGDFFGQVFDQSMLITQDARPAFAGAAEPKKHSHAGQYFWVVRPRDHYLQTGTHASLFCNARWTSHSDGADEEDVPPSPSC